MPEIEELMLKREHFPLELDFGGGPFDNSYGLIPPFHPDIVKNGIDLELALSVIGEAVENTLLDLPNYERLSDEKIPRDSGGKFNYGEIKKDETHLSFPKFPFTGGLVIEKNKISPHGGDYSLRIDKDEERSYTIPEGVPMSPKLLEEYQMEKGTTSDGYFTVSGKTGWYRHNVSLDASVFYKNLIIALNNAIVKRKYAVKA